MGNKIGFQADNQTVKIAYVQQEPRHIEFIHKLKSKYLKAQIKWSNSIIFIFQCTIEEFLSYHTSYNVQLLRDQFQHLLNVQQIIVRTNTATMNVIKQNKQLQNALKDILMKKFTLKHTERIQNMVTAMKILSANHQQFYRFKNIFSITQLHNFTQTFVEQKHILKNLPDKFVLIVLRNGITAYKIQRGQKTERIDGSIIGEKTILSILQFKYPNLTTQNLFSLAFQEGDINKVDLMVEDIYGTNSHNLGLPGKIIASSLGKIPKLKSQQLEKITPGDVIRSIITSFAINISNLTALYLQRSSLNDAIILADLFHNDKFYSLIQSISDSYAPGKSIHFSNNSSFMGCLGTAFTNVVLHSDVSQ